MTLHSHLPGCDERHKPRQRCSTWQPATPAPTPVPTATVGPTAEETRFWRIIGIAGCLGSIIWVPFSLMAIVMLLVGFLWAADAVDWIDSGDPNYIRQTKPHGVDLVETEHCCGGSHDDSGITQFFYGTDVPFSEIEAHYRRELGDRGFEIYPGQLWLSGAAGFEFIEPGNPSNCSTVGPYTDNYDLDRGLWSESPDRLRAKLAVYAHPYVLQFSKFCG